MTKNKRKLIFVAFIVLSVLFLLTATHYLFFSPARNSGPEILYRIPDKATMMAITGDLKYFDFIKDENALKFALWIEGGILGRGVDRGTTYEISQTMNTWQIANILLNQVYTGQVYDCDHGCPEGNFNPTLLPGGDLAPTMTQKYEWVQTYEDCVESIGSDGGQLSSDQYYQRTRKRFCTSPDGRQFTEGEEGWIISVGG